MRAVINKSESDATRISPFAFALLVHAFGAPEGYPVAVCRLKRWMQLHRPRMGCGNHSTRVGTRP